MTDFEKELLEQMRELRLAIGGLSAQVNKHEGTIQALVAQVTTLAAATPAEEKKSTLTRDTGLTVSGGAVAAIIAAFVQHWAK